MIRRVVLAIVLVATFLAGPLGLSAAASSDPISVADETTSTTVPGEPSTLDGSAETGDSDGTDAVGRGGSVVFFGALVVIFGGGTVIGLRARSRMARARDSGADSGS